MAIEPGPQFDGKDFDPKDFGFEPGEAEEMLRNAKHEHFFAGLEKAFFGEEGGFKAAMQAEALGRMRGIPAHMMGEDEDGHHAFHEEGGWKSTWHGGMYVEHSHPKHGAVDVTNVENVDEKGNASIPSLSGDELIKIHRDFLDYKTKNYPKEMQ